MAGDVGREMVGVGGRSREVVGGQAIWVGGRCGRLIPGQILVGRGRCGRCGRLVAEGVVEGQLEGGGRRGGAMLLGRRRRHGRHAGRVGGHIGC